MDLTICILGKILVVHTFVARRFQVRLDARAPSGEIRIYLLRRMSCNVEDLTPSTPFRDLILATNLWKGAKDTISLFVFKSSVATNYIQLVMMFAHQITCAAFHFVIWIVQLRNSRIKDRFISIFAELEHELLLELTEKDALRCSTSSLIVLIHVPNQIIGTFLLNLRQIYTA